MKKITLFGKEIEYRCYEHGDYRSIYTKTDFFLGTKEVTYRRYWFFGKKMVRLVPNFLFSVDFDIESTKYDEVYLRKKLEKIYLNAGL